MRTLVIYDNTGAIYLMLHGEEEVPQGLQSLFVDIPDGAQLERIDVTNPNHPQPVFTYSEEGVKVLDELAKHQAYIDDITLVLADVIGGAYHA